MRENRCVCCGEIIPEGKQVCQNCLVAVKPRQAVVAGCEACKELSKVYDGSQQLITAKFTNKKTGNPTFILVQEKDKEKEPQSVTIEVNFCPWCGRYLRGAEDA